jgi:metal-sulfur cluster biosynthetic enzyme
MRQIKLFILFFTIINYSFSQTTIFLESTACYASENGGMQGAESLSLSYTDSIGDGFDSSDNIDTTSSDPSIQYDGETEYFYFYYGLVYSVTFSQNSETNIIEFTSTEVTCDSEGEGDEVSQTTIFLESTACYASENGGMQGAESLSLSYTDSIGDGFDSSDNIDTTSSDPSIQYDGETEYFYFYYGLVYSVTFSQNSETNIIEFTSTEVTCDSEGEGDEVSQTTIFLESTACYASENGGMQGAESLSLSYTDSIGDGFDSSDNIDTTSSDPSIQYDGETEYFYFYYGLVYSVTFSQNSETNIIEFTSTEVTCDSEGEGDEVSQTTIFLESTACYASENGGMQGAESLSLSYTDSIGDGFDSSDNIDTTSSDPSIQYDGETEYFYFYYGLVYSVTFSQNSETNIIEFTSTEVTCDSEGEGDEVSQTTIFLESTACYASENGGMQGAESLSLSYTDSIGDGFDSSDNIDTTSSDPSIQYDGETEYFYFYYGLVYSVTFSQNSETNIIEFTSTEVTCDSEGEGDEVSQTTIFLESTACYASENGGMQGAESLSLSYTDSIGDGFDSSDNIDTTSSDPSIQYDGETEYFYFYYGLVYSVTFSQNSETNIIEFTSTEVTCDSEGEGDEVSQTTIFLESTACYASENGGMQGAESLSLSYTDSIGDGFDSSDNIDTTSSDPSIQYDGETEYFYFYYGLVYSVTFSQNSETNIIEFTSTEVTCDSEGEGDEVSQTTIFLESTACYASENGGMQGAESLSLSYTDSIGDGFDSSDNIDTTSSDPSIQYDGETEYFYFYYGLVYSVTFSQNSETNIIEFTSTEVTCDSEGEGDATGSLTVDLYTQPCDAYNYSGTSTTLTYTDVDQNYSFSSGDTADTTSNSSFNDGDYYMNEAGVFKVTLTTNGTNFDIIRGTETEDSSACETGDPAGGGNTYLIYDSATKACSQETTTALSLNLTEDSDNSLELNDAFNSMNSMEIPDFSATYYYNNGSNTYSIEFSSDEGPGEYIISEKNLINCAPSFTSEASFIAPENQLAIGTATATDPDADATQTYSITGDELIIDSSTGAITFAANPDFETTSSYTATVTVTDGTNPVTQEITVTVSDVNESPSFTSLNSFTAPENQLAIGTAAATDPDADATQTYSITGDELVIDASTGAITFAANPDFETTSSYTATVTVTDGTNPVTQEITVIVSDVNENPSFTSLNSFTAPENQLAIGTATATDPDADATQTYSITGDELVIDTSTGVITFAVNPDFETTSSYSATVTVTDGTNSVTQEIIVTVSDVDEISPIITLAGEAEVTIEVGSTYTDAGATAEDNYDGDISDSIVVNGEVDTNTVGSYTVTYDVSDANTNEAIQVTRTVIVQDTTAPVITLTGEAEVKIEVGSTYTDAGATAEDNYDGDISDSIVVNGEVDTNTVGSYTITYDVSDANTNEAIQVTLTVIVQDTTAPVITLTGEAEVKIEVGSSYSIKLAPGQLYKNIDLMVTQEDNKTKVIMRDNIFMASILLEFKKEVSLDFTATTTELGKLSSNGNSLSLKVNKNKVLLYGDVSMAFSKQIFSTILVFNEKNSKGEIGNSIQRISSVSALKNNKLQSIISDSKIYDSNTDVGATAEDNYDGDISDSIVVNAEVDTNTVGSYTVTYDVSDANTNEAIQVTRTVIVQDTTAPVITLTGEAEVTIEVGSTYTDAGATAEDNYDGDISDSIVVNGEVDTNTVGSYTVTYDVSDANTNEAIQVTRTVIAQDTTAPVITLTGEAEVTIEVGSTYTDAGATAEDNYDGDISDSIVVNAEVDTNTVGSYTITYDVSDANTNEAIQVTRTVIVQDTTAPVITLTGEAEVTIEVGSTYTDAGATAEDNYDGDISDSIVVNAEVDTNTVGSYTITYDVSDANTNEAIQVTRTVIVQDTTAPVITLTGEAEVTIEVGSTYTDAGATAEDNYDGDISDSIVVNGEVDTNTVGSYTITYDVSDSSGNLASSISRTIIVMTTLSIDEISKDKFTVYPNPTSSTWNVKSSVIIETVLIYDLIGRKVFSEKPMLNDFEISADSFPSGTYIMVLNGKVFSKLVRK